MIGIEVHIKWRICCWTLTGSLSGRLGVEHRHRVVSVESRLQERHGHGGHQRRQTLPQRRKMPAGQHVQMLKGLINTDKYN